MNISMITQVNTGVLTTGLVIPSGKYISTSSDIDPMVANTLIIGYKVLNGGPIAGNAIFSNYLLKRRF